MTIVTGKSKWTLQIYKSNGTFVFFFVCFLAHSLGQERIEFNSVALVKGSGSECNSDQEKV